MIDEENNFSFEADTGLDDDAATPAAHAAHMAPSSVEHANVPAVGAHMAEPVDAPQDTINALSGKIGRLEGVSAKTVYANISGNY